MSHRYHRVLLPALLMGVALPAHAIEAASDEIESILVVGERQSSLQTKTGVPILETPQNIQVISSQLMEDQDVVLLEDALKNIAGVKPGGYYNGWDYYRIRGFDAAAYTYMDGLRVESSVSTNMETSNMERIEILKGPNGSLYGAGAAGGLVNLISKTPDAETHASFGGSIGSFGFKELTGDVTGALNDSGTLSGRVVATYRETGSFVDVAKGTDRIFVAPSLTWAPNEDTKLTLLSHYKKDKIRIAMPLPSLGTIEESDAGEIDHEIYIGDASNPGEGDIWIASLGYIFDHKFSDSVSLHQVVRGTWEGNDWNRIMYPAYLVDSATLAMYPYFYDDKNNYFGADTSLNIEAQTGSIGHIITFGVEYNDYKSTYSSRQIDYADPTAYYYLNLFADNVPYVDPDYVSYADTTDKGSAWGFYVQDHISLTDRLSLTLGGRFDVAKQEGSEKDTSFAPRAGMSYQLSDGLYLFANYAETFLPQFGMHTVDGDQLEAETGESFEVGVKAALLDGRLNATAAVYTLTRDNMAASVPGTFAYEAVGTQKGKGFELDTQFILSDGWEMIAAYSYTETEIDEDPDVWTRNAPRHSLTGWMKYTIQEGTLEGLGFSVGGSLYSKQAGDNANSFYIPGYELFDANVTYTVGNVRLRANIKNIFDTEYYAGSYNNLYVLPGEPRSFRLSIGWKY